LTLPPPAQPHQNQPAPSASSCPKTTNRTHHPRMPSIYHPPSPTKVTVPSPRRANNAAHRGGGEWCPQSHRCPRQRHGTSVEGGRVEVGLPRVAETANRQRKVRETIYLSPAATTIKTCACQQMQAKGWDPLFPNWTRQQKRQQWEMEGHDQGWRDWQLTNDTTIFFTHDDPTIFLTNP